MAKITLAWSATMGDCPLCEKPIKVGEEIIKPTGHQSFRHGTCHQAEMKERRAVRVTHGQGLKALIDQVTQPGTIRLSSAEARAVVEAIQLVIPDIEPVSQPDIMARGQRWFGKIPGWSRERVCSDCMTTNEIVGFWIDHINAMRAVPFRKAAVLDLLATMEAKLEEPLVYAGAPLGEGTEGAEPIRWQDGELDELIASAHGRRFTRDVEVSGDML